MKFDAEKYVYDGGWDYDAIYATALLGVAKEDRYRIAEHYRSMPDAAAAEDAVRSAVRQLRRYCIERMRTG